MLPALPHLLGFTLPLVVLWGMAHGGWWSFAPVVAIFGVLPAVDALAGLNTSNPRREDVPALDASPWFRGVTWAWVPVQLALIAWGVHAATIGGLSPLELAGLTVSIGMVNGAIGITFAHELIHRHGAFERGLGEVLLSSVSYTHFCIEHVHGHHRHVATPLDPATARSGESFYAFLPRTVAGGLRSAWRIEVGLVAKRGLRWWHLRNRMLRYGLVQVAMYAAAWAITGPGGAVWLAAQAVIAFTMLEVINYVEHYGLVRRASAAGQYERVMPWHSWNSSHRVSNWLLINLARHSDHHYLAAKRYQVLEHLEAAPQLPAGYGTMFLAALVPPLWRRVMDPRVEHWRARHLA
jgi:alkane 1-monooxygenase